MTGQRSGILAAAAIAAGSALGAAEAADGPLSPAEAAAAFQFEADDLAIRCVAAEPLVQDPVAIAFDERGRMIVAENRGYPEGDPDGGSAPMGRIAILADTDADGEFDRRIDFADGLTFPNGVMPWRGGVLVTCAPELIWLRDIDGDGRADTRDVALDGFGTNASTQLRANDPTLAPDGWIWIAGGLGGGDAGVPGSDRRISLARGDVRWNPRTGEVAAVDGRCQFGHTFDAAGRRFICMNRIHAQHVVTDSRYWARQSRLRFTETVEDLPAERVDDLLPSHNAAARIFPISDNITTADSHAGTFSAACSVTFAAAPALPPRFRGQLLSCDPTGNLVHRDELVPSGATFAARRSADEREFLASSDNWFRPVFLADGPDGALYIVDMYRRTIEHPDYLPENLRPKLDTRSGREHGRIWRVSAAKAPPETLAAAAPLSGDSPAPETLAAALADPRPWARETAHRLIIENDLAAAAASDLHRVAKLPDAPDGSVRALSLLDRAEQLTAAVLADAMAHPHPDVREVALLLAEPRLADSAALRRAAAARAEDPSSRVRFQAALSLGEIDPALRAVEPLARIALEAPDDRWTRAAALSSAADLEREFLFSLIEAVTETESPDLAADLIRDAGSLAVAATPNGSALANQLASAARRLPATLRIALYDGLGSVPAHLRDTLLDDARRLTADRDAPIPVRLSAIRLLGAATSSEREPFLSLLDPTESLPIQQAAVEVLTSESRLAFSAGELLAPDRWSQFSPALRTAVIGALASRAAGCAILLDAIESRAIPAADIDPSVRTRLTGSSDLDTSRRAEELFSDTGGASRMHVFDEWSRQSKQLDGSSARGRDVFRAACASCHRLDGHGFAVGPDLFSIRNQEKDSILLHILVPNREIMPGFAGYTVEKDDGQIVTGLITSESPSAVTLRQPLGVETTILRSTIRAISALPVSLMPEGLESAFAYQDMANLLAYLKGE